MSKESQSQGPQKLTSVKRPDLLRVCSWCPLAYDFKQYGFTHTDDDRIFCEAEAKSGCDERLNEIFGYSREFANTNAYHLDGKITTGVVLRRKKG